MTYFIIVLYKSVHVMKFRLCLFFFKQKTAYEMRISDWSSDVCSSDLDPLDASDPDAVLAFEVLGASPAKSTRPWLALAVRTEALANLTVDGERFDPGPLGPDRPVVGFRGLRSWSSVGFGSNGLAGSRSRHCAGPIWSARGFVVS